MEIFFPFSNIIFVICLYMAVILFSIVVGITFSMIGLYFTKTILWETKKGKMVSQGNNVKQPWWLSISLVSGIVGIFGVLLSLYTLTGPYCYFIAWLWR